MIQAEARLPWWKTKHSCIPEFTLSTPFIAATFFPHHFLMYEMKTHKQKKTPISASAYRLIFTENNIHFIHINQDGMVIYYSLMSEDNCLSFGSEWSLIECWHRWMDVLLKICIGRLLRSVEHRTPPWTWLGMKNFVAVFFFFNHCIVSRRHLIFKINFRFLALKWSNNSNN